MSDETLNDEEKAIVLTCGVPAKFHTTVVVIMQTGQLNDYQHCITSLANEEVHQNKNNNQQQDSSNEKAFTAGHCGNNQGCG